MRLVPACLLALVLLVAPASARAAELQRFALQTSIGDVLVERLSPQAAPIRPAIIVLGGARGLGSPAYDAIAEALAAAGLDTYLVHVLSPADLQTIASAANASARIAYYAKRLPHWTATVQAAAIALGASPRHAGKVGVLGISLGAQIAAAATANSTNIDALVLVDGGFPNDYDEAIHSLPPLYLIWGGADRTFPPTIAQNLLEQVRQLGVRADLALYEGGAHDFFLHPDTDLARSAHQDAADFLASRLLR